jgi:hypothetical protein
LIIKLTARVFSKAHAFCGLGGQAPNGAVIPTCAWEVTQDTLYTIAPVAIFLIGAGQLDPDSIPKDLNSQNLAVIDFMQSNSRFCKVTQNPDGSFTVTPPDRSV